LYRYRYHGDAVAAPALSRDRIDDGDEVESPEPINHPNFELIPEPKPETKPQSAEGQPDSKLASSKENK
jgi:hypothetical protein